MDLRVVTLLLPRFLVERYAITGGETIFSRSAKFHNSPGSNKNRSPGLKAQGYFLIFSLDW